MNKSDRCSGLGIEHAEMQKTWNQKQKGEDSVPAQGRAQDSGSQGGSPCPQQWGLCALRGLSPVSLGFPSAKGGHCWGESFCLIFTSSLASAFEEAALAWYRSTEKSICLSLLETCCWGPSHCLRGHGVMVCAHLSRLLYACRIWASLKGKFSL